jgi:hypothetical protein
MVVGERLLVVLRKTVLVTGLIDLLTEIGRTRRGLVARGLEHGREIAIAIVKSVLVLRLFDRSGSARAKRRVVLTRRRCLVALVYAIGV